MKRPMSGTGAVAAAALACALAGGPCAAEAPAAKGPDLDGLAKQLAAYQTGQDDRALKALAGMVEASLRDAALRKELAAKLAALLATAATADGKREACRQLRIIGTEAEVPGIAALLTDKDLSHMARYALERMACAAAGDAIREALGKVEGQMRVGMVNSLGQRRDAKATDAMAKLLGGPDADAAEAAAAALGRIGTDEALAALAGAKPGASARLRSAIVYAQLDGAGQLLAAGRKAQAAALYRQIHETETPRHMRVAALRGLAAADSRNTAPKLIDLLKDEDPRIRSAAAELIRATPGDEATALFIAALPKLTGPGQMLMLDALAWRGGAAARQAVHEATRTCGEDIRRQVFGIFGRLADAGDVPYLAGCAQAKQAGAAEALVALRADGADEAIVGVLARSDPSRQPDLIRILAARDAKVAAGPLLKLAEGGSAEVRVESLRALAGLAGAEHAPALVKRLTGATGSLERVLAEGALDAVCRAAPRQAPLAPILIGAADGAKPPVRAALLRLLGRVGGEQALALVRAAIRDGDPDIRDTAIRVLGDWPGKEATEDLLVLARTAKPVNHHVLAIRGYIRMIGLGRRSTEQRLAMCKEAMAAARRPEERKLVLGELGKTVDVAAMRAALGYLAEGTEETEAASAAVQIAGRLDKAHAEKICAAMQQVLSATRDERLQRDAVRILTRNGGTIRPSTKPAAKAPTDPFIDLKLD